MFKVSQNIGLVNALIRITLGLTLVVWSAAKYTKRPWKEHYVWYILVGAMKVAEGIVRYCPVTALFDDNDDSLKRGTEKVKGFFGGNDADERKQMSHTPEASPSEIAKEAGLPPEMLHEFAEQAGIEKKDNL
ncbi:YgaP family membrane protein [Mangrovibacillus cuniculi]|uniref:DUF2892 domain-containing protein n=1 Tax=Mangrovibacillus cuniculi TaxID=2593652 RepID=A0A7S8C8T8_9BACI|nr:DUF2892 domain-containing protein [Mangrovibacillus cuniculi]QPC45494.1 DUF2892 domain-containing protein [Mangrovibacillus cuniculi]